MSPRVARILTAAALLLGSVALSSTEPAAAQDADEESAAVDLVSQTMWVQPDGDFSLRLDVSGAPRDATLTVAVHDRLDGRFELAGSIDGSDLGRRLKVIVDTTIAEADPDGDGRVDVGLGLRAGRGDSDRLLLIRSGLHPVEVRVDGAEGEPIGGFVTHFVRLPDQVTTELGVATVQPLSTPVSHLPGGTIEVDADTRATLTAATETFDDTLGVPVTFRFTPETLDALAASPEPLDAALLTDLAEMVDQGRLAGNTYVAVDIDALGASDMLDVVEDQLTLGADATTAAIDVTPDLGTWLADDRFGSVSLVELATRGVEYVVVPTESLTGDVSDPQLTRFDIDAGFARLPGLATDAQLESYAGSTGSSVLDAQHLLADLAAIWLDRPAEHRAVAVSFPDAVPDRTFVRGVLEGIAESPLLAPGTVPEVVDALDAALAGAGDDEEADEVLTVGLAPRTLPDMTDYGRDLERTSQLADTSHGVFGDDVEWASDVRRLAVSTATGFTTQQRAAYLDAITERIETDLDRIQMPERAAVTLPSRDGVIPITLVNNTGRPATVVLDLSSDKLEFPDGSRVTETLPDQLNPIEIRVRVRSSGAFPLEINLETPDGRVQMVESTYTIRSTAVSGLGIVLSVAAILVLVVWWINTARKARRAHHAHHPAPRDVHPDDPTASGADTAAHDGPGVGSPVTVEGEDP